MQYTDKYSEILSTKKSFRITTFFSQFDVFSQWHPSVFSDGGITYISAEQRMMLKKAELFQSNEVVSKLVDLSSSLLAKHFINGTINEKDILSDNDPSTYLKCPVLIKHLGSKQLQGVKTMQKLWSKLQYRIKMYGRDVKGYIESVWIENREPIVFETSYLKYSQNKSMKFKLMSTLGSILVEAAKNDSIWGVGMTASNPRIKNHTSWNGLNLLGKSLTNLRYYFTEAEIKI